jgi:hypothetical protein
MIPQFEAPGVPLFAGTTCAGGQAPARPRIFSLVER